MILFFVFVALFSTTVLISASPTAAELADHMTKKFQRIDQTPMTLESVQSVEDMWRFLDTSFVPQMLNDELLDQSTEEMSGRNALRRIDDVNRLLGLVQLRQLRVQPNKGCALSGLFTSYDVTCFGPYNSGLTASSEDFGPVPDQFTYTPDVGAVFQGKLAAYDSGGFVAALPYNNSEALAFLANLRANGFIDRASRALFLEFNVWNSNTNEYAVNRLVFEIAPTGVVLPHFRVLILDTYFLVPGGAGSFREIVLFAMEIAVCFFVMMYIAEEASELSVGRLAYLKDMWNIMDWCNLILLMASFAVRASVYISAADLTIGEAELRDPTSYTDLQTLAEDVDIARIVNGFNAVLVWGKVIKYVGFMPYIRVLVLTVEGSFRVLFSFLAMFAVGFVGFVLAYQIGFGGHFWGFSSFGRSSILLARSFIGDFNVLPLYSVQPVFASVLILLFVVCIFCLMLNVFFAILAHAFFEVTHGPQIRTTETEEADYRAEMMVESFNATKNFILKSIDFREQLRKNLPMVYARIYKAEPRVPITNYTAKRDSTVKKRRLTVGPSGRSASKPRSEAETAVTDVSGTSAGPSMTAVRNRVEHMAGGLLSKLQIIGFEVTSEMRESYDVMEGLQMAVNVLNQRMDNIIDEQQDIIDA